MNAFRTMTPSATYDDNHYVRTDHTTSRSCWLARRRVLSL